MAHTRLDHVGIAVRSIEAALPAWRLLAPDADVQLETVPGMQVRVARLHLGNTCLELIEPLPGEEPVTRFLDKRGEGIHHLCLEVPDVDAATRDLVARGFHPVYPEPRDGSGGTRVNFLSPKDTRGVLVEINSPRP